MQSIIPHRTLISQVGLRLTLGRSKASGPDKAQKEVKAFVYRQASFTGHDWLGTGYSIFDSDMFKFQRDYLVMQPQKDWHGVVRKFMTPQQPELCNQGPFVGAWNATEGELRVERHQDHPSFARWSRAIFHGPFP